MTTRGFPLYLVLIIILVSFLFLSSSALSSDLQLEMFLTLSSSCWSTCLWLATVLRSRSAISLRASPRILSDCWRDWSELHRRFIQGLFSIRLTCCSDRHWSLPTPLEKTCCILRNLSEAPREWSLTRTRAWNSSDLWTIIHLTPIAIPIRI